MNRYLLSNVTIIHSNQSIGFDQQNISKQTWWTYTGINCVLVYVTNLSSPTLWRTDLFLWSVVTDQWSVLHTLYTFINRHSSVEISYWTGHSPRYLWVLHYMPSFLWSFPAPCYVIFPLLPVGVFFFFLTMLQKELIQITMGHGSRRIFIQNENIWNYINDNILILSVTVLHS